MVTQQLLAEAVRDSQTFGPFPIGAQPAQNLVLTFPSSAWVDPGLTMAVLVEKSVDGGATWTQLGGFDGESGSLSKDGTVAAPAIGMSWDGQPCQVRITVTVGAPFSWGATLTRN
jgi:hypothetical protein